MITFDGTLFAQQKEDQLKSQVEELKLQGKLPYISAVLFSEDKGSQLYTQLKKQAAERVGMMYEVDEFSMKTAAGEVINILHQLNQDPAVTGIIIQKPWKSLWNEVTDRQDFVEWWHELTAQISEAKDVDGLHPNTLQSIEAATWRQQHKVLPATAKAVLAILAEAQRQLSKKQLGKIIILGKSDILGQPLFYELHNKGEDVEMIGSQELQKRQSTGQFLLDADVIISATGRHHLVGGDMVKEGVIVIDVGEPKPDVEFTSVSPKSSFITPVPGGVGPVTVVSLLENAVELLR